VPGFAISGQSGARGLGQGGANVLLNGTRFSGKSTSIADALQRIPAEDVIRIELVDGATLDIPGLSGQVVNLVYRSGGGSGQFRWSPAFRTYGAPATLLNGEVSWSGRAGRVDYTLSLANESFRQGNEGPEFLYDGTGLLVEERYERQFYNRDRPKLGGSLKLVRANGDIANLNGALEFYRSRVSEERDTAPARRVFDDDEDDHSYELGGDYALDLAGGRFKLIGLRRFETSDFTSVLATRFLDGSPDRGSRQDIAIDEGETILRGEYAWKGGASDWQIAAEGALNSLVTSSELFALDTATGGYRATGSSPETTVEERRAETSVTWGRPLAPGLTIQASLGGEYSELSQSGARGRTRSFVRPKGYVSAAWKAASDLDLRFRVERSVGQLNFFDFVASTDLNLGNAQAGNPNLVPEQSWDFLLEGSRTLGPWGSLTLTGIYRAIEDRVEQVPIGANSEAPGNIDGASSLLLKGVGTIRFDPLGWRGAQLEFTAFYNDTNLPDPLTGVGRPFSNRTRWQTDATLRHDVPATDWAWGAGVSARERDPGVRLNQLSLDYTNGVDAWLFVENKDVAGLKIRATAGNLFDLGENYRRTVFVDRRGGPIAFSEERFRKFGTLFTFQISGTFG